MTSPAESSHVSSDSSRDSGTSPVSPSPVFTQNQERSPAVRDADFKAVARAAKKKSRSSPPPCFNYLVPVVAALFIGGAAVTQLGKSLVLRGGARHEAAPSPCLHGVVSLKNIPPPAVGAPLALPAPDAPPVDAPSRSLVVAPLRASAAGQSAVATDGLTPTKLLECIALRWGKRKKHAGGFLQSRFKRRLNPVETFADIVQGCLNGLLVETFSSGNRTFNLMCYKDDWLLYNKEGPSLMVESLTEVVETGSFESSQVKNMKCLGKTKSGDFVYHVHGQCLAYYLDTLNILAMTCDLAAKGFEAIFGAYCDAFPSDFLNLTPAAAPYDPNVPNGTTTVFGNQYPAVNPTTNALAFPSWAIAVTVVLPIVFLILIVANAIKNIRQKRSTTGDPSSGSNTSSSLLEGATKI
eukprot:GHVT01067312.1.p1 GENE.GHVT01067312.1~~GHVT01067312.1.p1  ORF type:complete len:409 (-),score=46.62 GHVT01067312.1:92-1318(-)